jgi:uncharacterized protein with FMN-binding domain
MSKLKNKFIFSSFVVGSFIIYAIIQGLGRLTGRSASLVSNNQPLGSTATTDQPAATSQPVVAASQPAATSPTAAINKYRDGVYTGTSADAYYGQVQVKVTIKSGQITDVQFLDYPHDQENSININSAAIPSLRSEALAAQSAQVDMVSGATETSRAFMESLRSALSQAA